MAFEIFRLIGSIFIDNNEANKSIHKTDENAQSVGKSLLNGIGTAAKWGAAVVTGATVAGAAIYKSATATAANADEIDKMSQKIGISREAYQELDYVMSQNGMDVNKLQTGMKTLRTQMDSAMSGTGKAADTFKALGVQVQNSDGSLRSSEEVFYDAISALQNMENETQRNVLASQLFGKSATEMAPLLNSGAGSMEELTNKAHDLGLVLGDEVIDKGVTLTDTIDTAKRATSAIGMLLGGTLMPIVQQAAQFVIDNLPTIQKILLAMSPVISNLATLILPPLMQLVSSILPLVLSLFSAIMPILAEIFNSVLPVIITLLNTLLPPLIEIVNQLLPPLLSLLLPILDLLQPLIELLQPILDLVIAILQPIGQLINSLLTPLISVVVKLIEVALIPLQATFTTLSGILSGTFNAAVSLVLSCVDAIKGVFSGLITFLTGVFTGNWKKAWEGVKQIFSSIFEGIKGAFKAPINWIIDGINSFIRGINKIKIPNWVPGVGGKGFNIGTIPRLAAGGVLEKGQVGLLEGNGAEAVVPLENNRRWIDAVAEDMRAAGIGGDNRTVELLAAILNTLEEIVNGGFYMDKDHLVKLIARPMNKELGMIAAQKARG